MTPATRPSYARFARRFDRWRAGRPAGADLTAEAVAFIRGLPAVSHRNAAYALRAALGEPLDWERLKAAVWPPASPRPAALPVASTAASYAKYRRRFERWRAAHAELTDPTAAVATFIASLSSGQARIARQALRAALNGAVDWNRVPVPGHSRDELVLRATVLGAPERARLAAAPLTARERALLAACYVLRRFEVAALRWRDVDLASGMVYVRRGKGGRAAWTMLPPGPLAALRAWQAATPWPEPGAPVFPGRRTKPATVDRGGCLHADSLGHQVRQALRKAGLHVPHRGAHALRRTFASEFLRQNPRELEHLRVLMRHRRLDTTSLYCYLAPDDLRPKVAALDL